MSQAPGLRWRLHDSAAEFAAAIRPLEAEPLVNQMPLGLASALQDDPARFPGQASLGTVWGAGGELLGAVVRTGNFAASLSAMTPMAAAFAGSSAARWPGLDAAFGPEGAAQRFAEAAAEGRGAHRIATMGLWALHRVEDGRPAVGHMRPAEAADGRRLQEWLEAFRLEAVPHDPAPAASAGESLAGAGRAFLWCAPEPVALAAFSRKVGGYVSVGPVYTPPAARGRGFASALVRAMSRAALAQGHRGCTLFTDLANPTSNRIYAGIGYQRLSTMERWTWAALDAIS